MTYSLPRKGNTSLPIPKQANEPRVFFTLYRKGFDRVWRRVSLSQYYSERLAWNIWKEQIVKEPLSLTIRPCQIYQHSARSSFAKHHFNPNKEMMMPVIDTSRPAEKSRRTSIFATGQ